jgi:catechol 2,3-dioxygenase-like lactoylglutathione lyase family enzyme
MITKLSHVSFFVTDQEEAFQFYTKTLGFTVADNVKMDNGFWWLTVAPPEQPDLRIVLMPLKAQPPMFSEEDCDAMRKLQAKGLFGAGVFETSDIKKTYADLVAKGVVFKQPPTEKFYGIEAIMQDNSGNWFSMTQRHAVANPDAPVEC